MEEKEERWDRKLEGRKNGSEGSGARNGVGRVWDERSWRDVKY